MPRHRKNSGSSLGRDIDKAMSVGGLALVVMMAWQFGMLPGQTPSSECQKHFTVEVAGSAGVAFEANIHGLGAIGQRKFSGRMPKTYEFDAKGHESISIQAKKTEPFGELRVTLKKDGKVVAEKSTMDQYGSAMVSGI